MFSSAAKTILITGITGNLGAYMAANFLENGCRVYAISRTRFRTRILKCVRKFSKSPIDEEKLITYSVNISCKNEVSSIQLPEKIDEMWHFASSLKYMPRDKEEIFNANLKGLENILNFHMDNCHEASRFYYISTAYLAGKETTRVPEGPIPYSEDLAFHNYYEQSKLLAENYVLRHVNENKVNAVIFRPSIVMAESKNFTLINYNGYYLGLKAFFNLDEYARSKKDASDIRVALDPEGSMNLIPLDDVASIMYRLSNCNLDNGEVINIVNETEITLKDLFGSLKKLIGLNVNLCGSEQSSISKKSIYEKLVAHAFTYTMPYMKDQVSFETGNIEKYLGEAYSRNLYPDLIHKYNESYRKKIILTTS